MKRLHETGQEIRHAREEQGLRAAALCRKLGVDPRRQSDLELGRRQVAPKHLILVRSELAGVEPPEEPGEEKAQRGRQPRESERPFLRSLKVPAPDYDPPKDRHAGVRENDAYRRLPELTERLRSAYLARPDVQTVQEFLGAVSIGSYLEYLVLAEELGTGVPLRVAPHELGWSHYALVHPVTFQAVGDRRWPALGHRGKWGWMVSFRQPSIRTPQRLWTPDVLFYTRLRGQPPRWRIIDVDGIGHDPQWDRLRREQLALPLLSLDTETVEEEKAWSAIHAFLGTRWSDPDPDPEAHPEANPEPEPEPGPSGE